MNTPLAGDSMQLSYTQRRTVKRILIRYGNHGTLPKIHALRLCSHVRFCVRATTTYRLLPGVIRHIHSQG